MFYLDRELAKMGLAVSMLLFSSAAISGVVGGMRKADEQHAYGEGIMIGALFLFALCILVLVD